MQMGHLDSWRPTHSSRCALKRVKSTDSPHSAQGMSSLPLLGLSFEEVLREQARWWICQHLDMMGAAQVGQGMTSGSFCMGIISSRDHLPRSFWLYSSPSAVTDDFSRRFSIITFSTISAQSAFFSRPSWMMSRSTYSMPSLSSRLG